MDYDDPEEQARWCAERRHDAAAYLENERVAHGRIGEWPAWQLAPYVSVRAVESEVDPGWVGWWVICGDLPTDYLPAATIKHPRDALRAFALRWLEAAAQMAKGVAPPDFSIGPPAQWPTLSPLLASRARLLQEWAGTPGIWEDA